MSLLQNFVSEQELMRVYRLENCGGCSSLNEGQDCTLIEGASGVGCSAGRCVVFSCSRGYSLSCKYTLFYASLVFTHISQTLASALQASKPSFLHGQSSFFVCGATRVHSAIPKRNQQSTTISIFPISTIRLHSHDSTLSAHLWIAGFPQAATRSSAVSVPIS